MQPLPLNANGAVRFFCAASVVIPAAWFLFTRARYEDFRIARSPLRIQDASQSSMRAKHSHPYPPDAFPGARTVETPYGAIQVYEWGPKSGERVLLVHGITTPCVALAGIAHNLAEDGNRVMLFDLFGRGYSDAPLGIPYSSALYTTQILLVLASSPISWTGPNAFSIVGYSLGGGLAADFASYFPHLVSSLIFIAPGGLLNKSHVTYKSKLLYSKGSILPRKVREYFVGKRLYTKPTTEATIEPDVASGIRKEGTPDDNHETILPRTIDFKVSENIANDIVNWSIKTHPGMISAFISSIQNAPIHDQQSRWQKIECPCLLFLGRKDPIVLPDEVGPEAKRVLGDKVRIITLEGGHEISMSCYEVISAEIKKFMDAER